MVFEIQLRIQLVDKNAIFSHTYAHDCEMMLYVIL